MERKFFITILLNIVLAVLDNIFATDIVTDSSKNEDNPLYRTPTCAPLDVLSPSTPTRPNEKAAPSKDKKKQPLDLDLDKEFKE